MNKKEQTYRFIWNFLQTDFLKKFHKITIFLTTKVTYEYYIKQNSPAFHEIVFKEKIC